MFTHKRSLMKKILFSCLLATTSISCLAEPVSLPDDLNPQLMQEAEELLKNLDPAVLQELQNAARKQQTEYLESQLKEVLREWERIDTILEHLVQVVNNNQLPNINKDDATEKLSEWRQTVQEIKNGSYVIVDPLSISILVKIAHKFSGYIRDAVQTGLQTFPELDFQDIITRSLNQDSVDFEEMEDQIEQNNQQLDALDNEAANVGLSLFNRGYRKLESFVSDYQVFKRCGQGLVVGLATYLVLSRLDKDAMSKWYKKWTGKPETAPDPVLLKEDGFLKRTVGDHPTYITTSDGRVLKNTEKVGTLTKIEDYFGKGGLGLVDLTPPALITWATIMGPFKKEFEGLKIWTYKNWEVLRSKLRGGPVMKKVESWRKEPKVRFKDIIGKEHHKRILGRILDYIKDRVRYDRAGIPPEAGYLFAGASRTGKTFLAEALAGEIKDICDEKGVKFEYLYFNAAMIKEWGGFDVVMYYARTMAPAVLVIDEMDMMRAQREGEADTLSYMLTELSGGTSKHDTRDVIVIGLTNRATNLDEALLMKGRFGTVLWFDSPTLEERELYLKREIKKRGGMIDEEYIKHLARITDKNGAGEPCVFNDLSSIVITAVQNAKAEGKPLEIRHLESAYDEEILKVIVEPVDMPEHEKNIIASNLAGQVTANLLLQPAQTFMKATMFGVKNKIREEHVNNKYWIEDKDKQEPISYGKVFTFNQENSHKIATKDELEKQLKMNLAGHVAEKILIGSTGYTYHKHDRNAAYEIAKHICFKGMKEKELPRKLREKLEQEAYELVNQYEQEVTELLTSNKDLLNNISELLKEKTTVTAADIAQLSNQNNSLEISPE